MNRRITQTAMMLCALALCLAADEKKERKLNFLSKDSIDAVALLPAPSIKGSEEQMAEIDLILKIQEMRTAPAVDRAKSEQKLTVFAFADVLGPWFTAQNCPKTAELFVKAESDSKVFSKSVKDHWNRPRPPAADDRVKPEGDPETDAGYPSGHSTRAMLYAEILSQLFPAKQDEFLNRGRQIGWDRVILGVHYPSDVFAGRTLGHALAQAMLKNAEFSSDLEAVKSELARAQAPRPADTAVNASDTVPLKQ